MRANYRTDICVLYQIRLNNQMIVGAGLGINFGQYRQFDIKTRPYRFYGHLTGFDIKEVGENKRNMGRAGFEHEKLVLVRRYR
jgi:hypothetical protein